MRTDSGVEDLVQDTDSMTCHHHTQRGSCIITALEKTFKILLESISEQEWSKSQIRHRISSAICTQLFDEKRTDNICLIIQNFLPLSTRGETLRQVLCSDCIQRMISAEIINKAINMTIGETTNLLEELRVDKVRSSCFLRDKEMSWSAIKLLVAVAGDIIVKELVDQGEASLTPLSSLVPFLDPPARR